MDVSRESWRGLVSEPSFRTRPSDLIDVTPPAQLVYRPLVIEKLSTYLVHSVIAHTRQLVELGDILEVLVKEMVLPFDQFMFREPHPKRIVREGLVVIPCVELTGTHQLAYF